MAKDNSGSVMVAFMIGALTGAAVAAGLVVIPLLGTEPAQTNVAVPGADALDVARTLAESRARRSR